MYVKMIPGTTAVLLVQEHTPTLPEQDAINTQIFVFTVNIANSSHLVLRQPNSNGEDNKTTVMTPK